MARKDTAKLVAHVKKRQTAVSASKVGSKFNQSQSKFARRAEEMSALESVGTQSRLERMRRSSGGIATEITAPPHESNRQRKAALFALNESAAGGSAPLTGKRIRGTLFDDEERRGGMLGAATADLSQLEGGGDDADAIPSKQKKHERFEEIISDTRRARAQDKRERDERQQTTTDLDKEFDAVAHLLRKRDKRAEEVAAFQQSGSAEIRELLAAHRSLQGGQSRKLVIGDGGVVREKLVVGAAPGQAAPSVTDKRNSAIGSVLDAEDRALLAKLNDVRGKQPAAAAPAPSLPSTAAPVATPLPFVGEPATEDEFDKLMGTMRLEMRKAHATDRTLSEEEQAALALKAEKERKQKSIGERVGTEDEALTNREYIERGGQAVYRMDGDALDEDNDDEGDEREDLDYDDAELSEGDAADEEGGDGAGVREGAKKEGAQHHPLDKLLTKLEALCKHRESSPTTTAAASQAALEGEINATLGRLHDVCKANPKHAVDTFRLLLLEGNRRVVKGKGQSLFTTLSFFLAAKIFPLTDFRHPVITPLTILLCSILAHTRLESLQDIKWGLIHCALLVHILSSAGKFAAEPISFLLNVLGMMAPLSVLQPRVHEASTCPFPLMARSPEALLGATATASAPTPRDDAKLSLFDSVAQPNPLLLVNVAYSTLLTYVTSTIRANAGLPALVDVVGAFSDVLAAAGAMPPKVRDTHLACLAKLQELAGTSKSQRTPLAMRTFRPAPLRQFDPQLVETMDSDKRELQDLKKDMREERKRVVRHVQAEAAVERRAREKEQQADAERRVENLNKLMGELQQQQHVMKTVDMFRNKAKSKKKKGLDGKAGSGDADGGAPAVPEY